MKEPLGSETFLRFTKSPTDRSKLSIICTCIITAHDAQEQIQEELQMQEHAARYLDTLATHPLRHVNHSLLSDELENTTVGYSLASLVLYSKEHWVFDVHRCCTTTKSVKSLPSRAVSSGEPMACQSTRALCCCRHTRTDESAPDEYIVRVITLVRDKLT
jgi:hypothetical protein